MSEIGAADGDYPADTHTIEHLAKPPHKNLAGGHIAGRAWKRTLPENPDWISLFARIRSLLSDNFTLLIVLENLVKNPCGTATSPM
jgi:hypothetical protein